MRGIQIKATLILTSAFMAPIACAQQVEWVWPYQSGDTQDRPVHVAAHPDGDVVISGFFEGTIDFDPGPGVFEMTAPDPLYTFFLSKVHPDGNLAWAFLLDSISIQNATSGCTNNLLRVDDAGNIYVLAGTYNHVMVDVDPGPAVAQLNSTSPVPTGFFVAKYDANGEYIDAFQVSGYIICAQDMAIGGDGSLYTTGEQGTGDHDPTGPGGLFENGPFFLARYDSDFNFQRLIHASSIADLTISVTVDQQGHPELIGNLTWPTDMDANTFGNQNLSDNFMAEYDTSGAYLYGESDDWGTSQTRPVRAVRTPADEVFLIGNQGYDYMDFEPGPDQDTLNIPDEGGGPYIACYDAAHHCKWAFEIQSPVNNSSLNDLALGSGDNVVVIGTLGNDLEQPMDVQPWAGATPMSLS